MVSWMIRRYSFQWTKDAYLSSDSFPYRQSPARSGQPRRRHRIHQPCRRNTEAGRVVRATPGDVDLAVKTGWDAFHNKPWRNLRPDQRASVLYEIGRRLKAERERLAHLQMLDSGKPLKECLNMVNSAA